VQEVSCEVVVGENGFEDNLSPLSFWKTLEIRFFYSLAGQKPVYNVQQGLTDHFYSKQYYTTSVQHLRRSELFCGLCLEKEVLLFSYMHFFPPRELIWCQEVIRFAERIHTQEGI